MTLSEFQSTYHDYSTLNELDAAAEAAKVNAQLVVSETEPEFVVAAHVNGRWCLMLLSAYVACKQMGIL